LDSYQLSGISATKLASKVEAEKLEQREWMKLMRQCATNDRYAEMEYPVLAPHVLQGVR